MFAIARENATCDDSFDSSLQLLVIAAGAGRLPQMVIFRALQPVHSNTIMTFLAREPHREISEMIYWISGPRSGSPGFPPAEGLAAVHKERYLQFFTEEQFERLGSGRERRGRRGVRVNWRGKGSGGGVPGSPDPGFLRSRTPGGEIKTLAHLMRPLARDRGIWQFLCSCRAFCQGSWVLLGQNKYVFT